VSGGSKKSRNKELRGGYGIFQGDVAGTLGLQNHRSNGACPQNVAI